MVAQAWQAHVVYRDLLADTGLRNRRLSRGATQTSVCLRKREKRSSEVARSRWSSGFRRHPHRLGVYVLQ